MVQRYAGVNSFGFGGTNAHVVLQEAPLTQPAQTRTNDEEQTYLLPLSARSAEALQATSESFRDFLVSDSSTSLRYWLFCFLAT